jgi:hypothetical protein
VDDDGGANGYGDDDAGASPSPTPSVPADEPDDDAGEIDE